MVGVSSVHSPVDVIGIGAQKAGTTSLWAALRRQPWFGAATSKELHYFNFNHHLGDRWYHDQFPPPAVGLVRGEVTPDYLWNRAAPLRMHRYNPQLRLIAILRDPVERAFSAFLHAQRLGAIPRSRSFEMALEQETKRYGAPWSNLVEGGLYYRHLQRYLEYFPSDQLHVVLFEELTDPATGALAMALQFAAGPERTVSEAPILHRNRFRPARLPRVQRAVRRGSDLARRRGHGGLQSRLDVLARRMMSEASTARPQIDPVTRAALTERFAPENAALAKLIGRELTPWLL